MIVLFDGACELCNNSVQFIINRDSNKNVKFATLQGATFDELNKYYNLPQDTDSIIVIHDDQIFIESRAAIEIVKQLDGKIKWLAIFQIIPRPIRDILYQIVAKSRYRVFGTTDTCWVMTPDLKERFLDPPQ